MDIVLVHPVYKPPSKLLAFYDGHTVAKNGVIRIPYDGERSIRWAKNAYLNGYRSRPDGTSYLSWAEVQQEIDRLRSAESADVNTKSVDIGGLSETQNGVRESQQDSGRPVSKARVGSRSGSRSND
jgi:hypothetical protein